MASRGLTYREFRGASSMSNFLTELVKRVALSIAIEIDPHRDLRGVRVCEQVTIIPLAPHPNDSAPVAR
jgi:hypothetical protein